MRRLLLAFALVLAWASSAQAQFVWVAEDEDSGGLWNTDGIHSAAGLVSQCTAGHVVFIVTEMSASTQTITSIDDASTTVYARIGSPVTDVTRNIVGEAWWGICAGTGAGQNLTVTANAATSHAHSLFSITQFSNASGIDADQAGAQVTGTGCAASTTCTTSSLTPTTSNSVFIGWGVGTSTTTAYVIDSDFTSGFSDARKLSAYRIQTGSTTAQPFTMTGGGGGPDAEDMSVFLVVFEQAAGGTTLPPVNATTLGVGGS
jgi:hypothetical protein